MMVSTDEELKWRETHRIFQEIERLHIDQCHNEKSGSDDTEDGEDDIDEPYFVDPNDRLNSARITGFQVRQKET